MAASIRCSNYGYSSDTLACYIENIGDIYSYGGQYSVQWLFSDSWFIEGEVDATSSESWAGEFAFTNLEPGTTYDIEARVWYKTDRNSGFVDYVTLTATFDTAEDSGGGGGGDIGSGNWDYDAITLGTNLSSTRNFATDISAYTVNRLRVSFAYSGTATFYTTGSVDTRGYLSTTTGFDSDNGRPSSYIEDDDDSGSGNNFSFTYDVVAGTTYYLWVRGYSSSTRGSTVVVVEPPTGGGGGGDATWLPYYYFNAYDRFENVSSETSFAFDLIAGRLCPFPVTFASSGTAAFYTTGSVDTKGYLSTSSEFNSSSGIPNFAVAEDDDTGSGNNFSFTYNVTAGTTYYLWVRGYSASTAGSVTVVVVPPSGGSGSSSANIALSEGTYDSVLCHVIGLDASYNQSLRSITWSYKAGNNSYTTFRTDNLPNQTSQSNGCRITGLMAGTDYTIRAVISGITGSEDVTLTAEFTTDETAVTAKWMANVTAEQTQTCEIMRYGEGVVRFGITFNSSGTATFYTKDNLSSSNGRIDVYGYLSRSDEWDSSTQSPKAKPGIDAVIKSDDDSGGDRNFRITNEVQAGITYYVWIRVLGASFNSNLGTVTFVVVPPAVLSIDSFSVSNLSGQLAVNCSWTITGNKSSAVTEIRVSTTSPTTTTQLKNGTLKATNDWETTGCQVSFDRAITYYIWLLLYDGSTYIEASDVKSVTVTLSKPSSWSWNNSETSAFSGHGRTDVLTVARWNSFIDRVNLVIKYYNAYNNGSLYLIYDDYKVGTDGVLYATGFNEVRSKIDNLCGRYSGVANTGISSSDIASGKVVYGHYFTDMSGALNRVISRL